MRDIVIPGARLRGRLVRDGDEGRPVAPGDFAISVRLAGHDYPAAFRSAVVATDGSYHIDGLEAGTWVVAVHPGGFVQGQTVEVTIGPEDTVVVRDSRLESR